MHLFRYVRDDVQWAASQVDSSQVPMEPVVHLSDLALVEFGAPRAIQPNWDSVRLTP